MPLHKKQILLHFYATNFFYENILQFHFVNLDLDQACLKIGQDTNIQKRHQNLFFFFFFLML